MATKVRCLVFNGESGEFLHEWPHFGDDLQLGWDLTGPVAAGSTVPWGSSHFGITKLQPGGVPVVVEIDARGRGVPEVWTGQFSGVDVASGRGARGVSFEGPSSWLDSEDAVVRSRETAQASPGPFIAGLLSTYPLDLRLDIGTDIFQGPGLPIALNGQSVAGLMSEVAGMTGEEPVLTARPGTGRLWFGWSSAFAPLDQTPVVALGEGRHVEWSYTGAVLARSELTVMGQSFDAGNRVRSVAARAVGGRVLGRKAALAAVLEEYGTRQPAGLKDGSGAIVDPLEGATAALRSMVMTNLRRWITPRYPIVITLTDRDVWPLIQRGCLLRVQFPSDDYGIYQDAVVRVQTRSWKLGGGQVCEIGAELWETSASYG